jgi:hypothetical protein
MSSEITPTYTEPRILTIRGVQVMLDRDIAYQFGTETKFINRCVSRNRERFPIDFVFQLASSEWEDLRFQFGTSRNNHGGRRYLPFAFTEQGVAMLATILKTEKAIAASIQIIRTFIQLRNTLLLTHGFLNRIEGLEIRQIESEKQIDSILDSLKKGTFAIARHFLQRSDLRCVCLRVRTHSASIRIHNSNRQLH